MTESTAGPWTEAIVDPITVDTPPSGLLRELNVLLESRLSREPLSPGCTTLRELRLDGDGWPSTVVAAADITAAVGAAAGPTAYLEGRKQPHYYVTIHITAVQV
jgi:hypothetical protein